MTELPLPTKAWEAYEGLVRAIGERRATPDGVDLAVLQALGLVDAQGSLSKLGHDYFVAAFIHREQVAAYTTLQEALLNYPPAAAIVQLLSGVAHPKRAQVETVLRSQGLGERLTDRSLGSLLMLMHRAGLLKYVKSKGTVQVLILPDQVSEAPRSMFVSPETPYGNRAWLRRIIRESDGFLYWFDKHFQAVAFDDIWDAVDGSMTSEVRVALIAFAGPPGEASAQKLWRSSGRASKEGRYIGVAHHRQHARSRYP